MHSWPRLALLVQVERLPHLRYKACGLVCVLEPVADERGQGAHVTFRQQLDRSAATPTR